MDNSSAQDREHRISINENESVAEFVKQTKDGGISLHLLSPEGNDSLPTYGNAGVVEGTVIVSKSEEIVSIDVKIEGVLKLHEVAEGGTMIQELFLERIVLWSKDRISSRCPAFLSFKLPLPTTFSDGEHTYPLPPTYEERLPGLPGFTANINYGLHLVINNKYKLRSALFGHTNTLSTPFIYYPRTRPAVPLPPPLRQLTTMEFTESPDWTVFEERIVSKSRESRDIISKLYLPASRVFCLSQPIPFHLTFTSSAFSLAAFLPYAPVESVVSAQEHSTKIELLRQSTVAVQNKINMAVKPDIWRVDRISHNTLKHTGDGRNCMSFTGEIFVIDSVNITGFKTSGLSVKDCIVLSVVPPDLAKSPFTEMRQVIPVRLTTDAWVAPGNITLEGSVLNDDF